MWPNRISPSRDRPNAIAGGSPTSRLRDAWAWIRAARPWPRTLWGRLALTFAVAVVVAMAAFGFFLLRATRDITIDGLSQRLETQGRLVAEMVAPLLEPPAGIDRIDSLADRAAALSGARVTVVGGDGRVLGDSTGDPGTIENQGGRPEIEQARLVGTGEARGSPTGDHFLFVAVRVPGAADGVVRLGMPLSEVDQAVHHVQNEVLLATLIAALVVAGIGVWVANRISGPLDDLRRQATAVAAGRLDVAVIPDETQELGELGRAFNAMTRRLSAIRDERDRAGARLEVTLTNLSDGVIITDHRGAVLRMNAAAGSMLSTPPTDTRQPFVEVARDHELAALLREALADGSGKPLRATIEHGRSRRMIEASAQRLDAVGEQLGLMVLRDVTDLRRLEGVRREFVANVSHELRTPLASIRALVETLEAGAVDDPAVANDFLRRIVGEVDRLNALVEELLDLARLESGRVHLNLEAVDPAMLLGHAVDRLRPQTERARVRLDVSLPPALPAVRVDQMRIEQVVLNLVHNAIKFTPAGGSIHVSARAANAGVEVTVRDTGVGIAADELPRLFERFYKGDKARRSEGTGLGLAIAKHIVQAHGGAIWAESRLGAGSAFTFSLPISNVIDRRPAAGIEAATT